MAYDAARCLMTLPYVYMTLPYVYMTLQDVKMTLQSHIFEGSQDTWMHGFLQVWIFRSYIIDKYISSTTAFSTWYLTVLNQIESFSLHFLSLPSSFEYFLQNSGGGGGGCPHTPLLFRPLGCFNMSYRDTVYL